MRRTSITSRFVESVKPPVQGIDDYSDAILPGLLLRVSAKGGKTWVATYRSPVEKDRRGYGKQRRYKLGKFPQVTLSDARDKAGDVLKRVDLGEDPHREKQQAKEARPPFVADPVTLQDGVRRYIEEHVKIKCKSRQRADGTVFWELERMLENDVLSYMGGLRIVDVTRKDVLSMQRRIEGRSGPVAAERAAEALRAALNWLDDAELVDGVPIIRLKKKDKKVRRHRILTNEEIRTLWNGLNDDCPFGGVVRILLLTGQRRGEVAAMRWDELNLVDSIWSLPAGRTKNGLPHLVPLSKPVLKIINARERLGEFVFTTTGTTPFSGFSRSKHRLDGRIGYSDWILHDLRRTFVTRLNELGISPHIVEATVNHISGEAKAGVAGIYNQAQYLPERTAALNMWPIEIDNILRGKGGE